MQRKVNSKAAGVGGCRSSSDVFSRTSTVNVS